MPQRIRDYGVAALGLAAVLVTLTSLDKRVPGRLTEALSDFASGEWLAAGSPIGNAVLSNPAVDNMFVAALLIAAAVLVFLLVRT